MKRAITILLALVMVLSLCACGGTSEPEPTPEPTTEPTPEPTPDPEWADAQDFAARYFTVMARTFVNPLSVKVIKAWYYKDLLDDYYFTYQIELDNSAGIKQTVYYGNKTFGFEELTDEAISEAQYFSAFGLGTYFVENAIDAMQKGIELDAEAIQEYYFKNVEL